MHSMQTPCSGSLIREVLGDVELTQLLERHQSVLAIRNSGDLAIRIPPAGPKAIYISTLRPVGGGVGGHVGSLTPAGARVVR